MNKNITVSLVLLVIILLAVFELIMPLFNQVSVAQVELRQLMSQEKDAQAVIDKIKDLNADYEAMKEETARIDVLLPDKEDLATIITSLEAMAGENGLLLESISFAPPASPLVATSEASWWKNLSLQVSASGSYLSFKNFLQSVEKNMRLMEVKSTRLTSQEKDRQFKINIDLETHYLGQ